MNEINKRFNLLTEYAFINDKSLYKEKNQIDSNLMEDEEEDPLADMENFEDEPTEIDEPEDMDLGDDNEDTEVEPAVEPQDTLDTETDSDEDISTDSEGDIELDVTDIVNDTQESKEAAINTSKKIDQLLGSIEQVLRSSEKIDSIIQRMDNIEQEIIKRNPTKDEKIEMQSLHSAPYTVKLGDFWADKSDQVIDLSKERPTFDDIDNPEKNKEITLDPKDIESSYSEIGMKDSYDFEEEEVDDYNS